MATLVELDLEAGGTAIAFIGRIYKISAPGFDKCYVGSTKREINVRMSGHKGAKHAHGKGKGTYCTSYEVLSHEGAKICWRKMRFSICSTCGIAKHFGSGASIQ